MCRMHRFFEILPGALSWGTLALMVAVSWKAPLAAAIFIIAFDVYWLFKTVYLSLHLRSSFARMRANEAVRWRDRLEADPAFRDRWRDVWHLVIVPMYREPDAVVRESFAALARVNYPRERMLVVLAIEERVGEDARRVAERITGEFGGAFGKFLVTVHPQDIPGELAGKGSNETWAAREAVRQLVDPAKIPHEKVLVSVFDADSVVGPEYFGVLTHAFLASSRPQRSSFQPIPLFTNNVYETPALARVVAFSSTFWHMMQQERPEQLTTFSSHSMPLAPLIEAGFWNTDTVSEDSQIFWKLYLHFDGDWRTVPLFYPIAMDASTAPTFWKTMKSIYLQQRRWAWGVENIPYVFSGFMRRPQIPRAVRLRWAFKKIEAFHSWATNALLIFAMGWLPIFLGEQAFQISVLSYNLPRVTGWVMNFAMFGIATSAILAMTILPPKPSWFRARHYAYYLLQWVIMPVTLIVFGAIPALDAQTRLALGGRFRLGFWFTPKFRSEAETGGGK